MIKDFEAKIETFFEYIKTDDLGKRLVTKITDGAAAFSQDEILQRLLKNLWEVHHHQ